MSDTLGYQFQLSVVFPKLYFGTHLNLPSLMWKTNIRMKALLANGHYQTRAIKLNENKIINRWQSRSDRILGFSAKDFNRAIMKWFNKQLWTHLKQIESQKRNRKYKEKPKGYFSTEEYNNWNFKSSVVDGLNRRMEGTEGEKSVNWKMEQ